MENIHTETTGLRTNRARSETACEELKLKTAKLKEELKETGSVARAAVKEVTDDLKCRGAKSVSAMSSTMTEKKQEIERYVEANPMKSVLIGAGAGLALGFLAACKRNQE